MKRRTRPPVCNFLPISAQSVLVPLPAYTLRGHSERADLPDLFPTECIDACQSFPLLGSAACYMHFAGWDIFGYGILTIAISILAKRVKAHGKHMLVCPFCNDILERASRRTSRIQSHIPALMQCRSQRLTSQLGSLMLELSVEIAAFKDI
eukprot:6192110-Pleurochrysis_carterae.AAC.2